jgi:GDP-4-dehydro-6-deoxy-D-mannose reductase
MRILCTGISGFAASHLAKELKGEIHGTVRVRSDLYKIKDAPYTLHLVEMTDALSVEKVIKEVMPDEVYHLAAQSYVRLSWDAPLETYRVNVEGTINLFEALRKYKPDARILVTSTSEVYGQVEGEIHEETVPNPNTHYGISKYTQECIARLYARSYGMNVVITRAFNITGWGRGDVFVDSSFAKQIVEIEKGKRDVIKHGNLSSERDFVDVHDVVQGYIKALRSERWGEVFCLGSGKPRKIDDILTLLFSLSNLEKITREVDEARMRPTDTKTMKCDYTKAKNILAWEPRYPIERSLEDLLIYWRERI